MEIISQPTTKPVVRKPRLEWLDALRGFTMIMVVAYHVCQQGFLLEPKVSSSMPFLVLFRMPLFLSVLDEDLKKYDDTVWEEEASVRETAFQVMPVTLLQFSVPQEETDSVIAQCVDGFLNK